MNSTNSESKVETVGTFCFSNCIPDDYETRVACTNVHINLKVLAKEIQSKISFKNELNKVDKDNWEFVVEIKDMIPKINIQNYSSWDKNTLKVFKGIEEILQIGVNIIDRNESNEEKIERKARIEEEERNRKKEIKIKNLVNSWRKRHLSLLNIGFINITRKDNEYCFEWNEYGKSHKVTLVIAEPNDYYKIESDSMNAQNIVGTTKDDYKWLFQI